MTICEAASTVLEDERGPLHIRDIYDRIIERRLYSFKAQNPMHVFTGEIRRHCDNITFPSASKIQYYVRIPDGRYALRNYCLPEKFPQVGLLKEESEHASLEDKLEKAYKRYRDSFKNLLLEELKNISPIEFERFATCLLKCSGSDLI